MGKLYGLSGLQKTLLCALLLLYPAFSGGTSYDIHENCFLIPLILWIFYGIERKNTAIIAVSALLTLSVKEDAAVYVGVIGLWLLIKTGLRYHKQERKTLITGAALTVGALGWFLLVTGYLANSGDGVMTYRYGNFMYDGSSSLMTVIKAVLMSPQKALYECVDPEKLAFIAGTMLPLLGLPLLTRRYERYILLIPYVLVNLMPDYQYQHDIFFQYTFGSTGFLMYLTLANLADLRINWQRVAAIGTAAAVSAVFFALVVVPKGIRYPQQAMEYRKYYQDIRDTLDRVPEHASVAATTFYTTHLSQREVLYDVKYCSRDHLLQTEYVVLKPSEAGSYKKYATGGEENGYDNLLELLRENGYTEYASCQNAVIIFRKE